MRNLVTLTLVITALVVAASTAANGEPTVNEKAAASSSLPAVQKLMADAIKNRIAFNYEVAISLCKQALKLEPNSKAVLQEKAGNEYRAEWFSDCIGTTSQLLKLQATNVAAREMRANSLYALKQYGSALADLRIVSKESKDPAVTQLMKTCERLVKTGSAEPTPPEGR